MITGIGNDLVEIARMDKILSGASQQRFIDRVLTKEERQLASLRSARLAEFVSGRFAAKEAVVKALGCGIGELVGFQDITIMPDKLGKPHCKLSAQALSRLALQPDIRIHVSITHSGGLAAAFAIIEIGVPKQPEGD